MVSSDKPSEDKFNDSKGKPCPLKGPFLKLELPSQAKPVDSFEPTNFAAKLHNTICFIYQSKGQPTFTIQK